MLSDPLFIIQYTGFGNFFAELFILAMILMRKFEHRPNFVIRLVGVIVVSPITIWFPNLYIGIFNYSYIIICAGCVAAVWFLYKVKFRSACFYTLSAWAAQHIAWALVLIFCFLAEVSDLALIFIYTGIYILVYVCVFFGFSFRRTDYELTGDRISAVIVSFLTLFLTIFLYDLVGEYDQHTLYYSIYAIIACLLVLFVQYGFTRKEILTRKAIELETGKAALQDMLYSQQKQQQIASDTVDIINYKCHDLKHQISALRSVMTTEDRSRYLDELENAVMIYSNIAKTGNDALDVILTEKALLCEGHGIKLTYIADGKALDFMDPVDISSLFGNIPDNAISSTKDEDPDKRFIRMNIAAVAGYIRIHSENYCGHDVPFEDGLPVSPNASSGVHGFGSKSMRYIAEKYGGKLFMSLADSLFTTDVVIPLGPSRKKDRKEPNGTDGNGQDRKEPNGTDGNGQDRKEQEAMLPDAPAVQTGMSADMTADTSANTQEDSAMPRADSDINGAPKA